MTICQLNLKTFVSVPLSLFLIAVPDAVLCQNLGQATTGSGSQATAKPPTTAELSRGVGLNGILTKPEDIARWNLIKDELTKRANLDRNWDAMYALGREEEFPSVKGKAPNWNDATWWYRAGEVNGSYAAKWHLGSLYVRDLVPGSNDHATGRADMQSALNHGYNPATDSYDVTPAANNPAAALALVGVLAGLLVMSQAGSNSDSSAGGNGKHCMKQTRTWVATGHDTGHWQTDSYAAYGASCP